MSDKTTKLLDQIAELSVLELSELVKAVEEKFDVKAVAMAAAPAAAPAAGAPAAVEEKSEFEVMLTNAGANKIGVIKVVREFKPELGLAEAKGIVDTVPASLGHMKKEAAEEAKKKLSEAGATVELK